MRILISGTCPAALNSNYGLLQEITRGFEQLSSTGAFIQVLLVPLEELTTAIQDWTPTCTLLVGGLALTTISLPLIRNLCDRVNSHLVFWSLEDPYELDWVIQHSHWFDLLITNDAASRFFYPGDKLVKHLPLASRDRPLKSSGNLIKHSAIWLFCGVPFENRLLWINSIVQNCPLGLLIGPDWPDFSTPTIVRRQRISSEVLNTLYSCLPITIYLGRDLNFANSSQVVPSTPGPRLFECAGSSGRQLVCGAGLELDNYYDPGKEILVASSYDEATDQLLRIATEPSLLDGLAERSWHRTQSQHLYRHRAQQIYNWLRDL